MESLYNYLLVNYKENEPILLAALSISGISPVNMRQQLKKLTDSGKLKRFDSGVYYLPKKSIFKFKSEYHLTGAILFLLSGSPV